MWQVINSSINAYIGILIMLITTLVFGKIILNEKVKISKLDCCLLIVFVGILQTIVGLNFEGALKTVVMTLLNVYFYIKIFNISYRESILISLLEMLILIIPDLLELFFLTKILGLSKERCYEFYARSIASNIIICILLIIIVYSIKEILRKLINTKIEKNTKILFFLILTFICIGLFFYTLIREYRLSDNIILYIISIIVLAIVLFSLIKETINNNKLIREYDKLLEFMVTYENEIEKQRVLRHEIKNEFRTIRAKINDKQEDKEIVEYIDEIVNDKYEVKQEKYAKFGYLPPNGIKGLCYFKVQEAEEKGIKVSLNISKRIKQSSIYELDTKNQRDLGRILGVFLDNAIEASLNSEQKQLGIEAYITKEKEFKIIISNTYNNEIDKEKIGKESLSTKGKGRGHGLLLVKHIVENNKLFETFTDIQEKIYVQTIIIKKKI